MTSELTPTLWRTCRALANRRRLELLRAMLDAPPQSVGQLAERCGLSESACSQYLRQVGARGLCRSVRQGRWVLYELAADPKVKHATRTLVGLKSVLKTAGDDLEPVLFSLTAYTHPRRIEMVALLQTQGPLDAVVLGRRCGMSAAALWRHIDKLSRRHVVECVNGIVALLPPQDEFARILRESISVPSTMEPQPDTQSTLPSKNLP